MEETLKAILPPAAHVDIEQDIDEAVVDQTSAFHAFFMSRAIQLKARPDSQAMEVSRILRVAYFQQLPKIDASRDSLKRTCEAATHDLHSRAGKLRKSIPPEGIAAVNPLAPVTPSGLSVQRLLSIANESDAGTFGGGEAGRTGRGSMRKQPAGGTSLDEDLDAFK